MQVEELVWHEQVVEKIQHKHRVTQTEVKEVFFSGTPHFRGAGGVAYAFGQTQAGRYLFIVFKPLGQRRAEIITAREMNPTEKRYYKKRKGLR